MAITGLDFNNIYAQGGAAASNMFMGAQNNHQSVQPAGSEEKNIFAGSVSGTGSIGPSNVNTVSGAAQANMGLVSRLDSMDSGSLKNPEQRDDEHGRKLYCLG